MSKRPSSATGAGRSSFRDYKRGQKPLLSTSRHCEEPDSIGGRSNLPHHTSHCEARQCRGNLMASHCEARQYRGNLMALSQALSPWSKDCFAPIISGLAMAWRTPVIRASKRGDSPSCFQHPIARHASAVAISWHPIARHASAVAIPWHPIARHASAVAIPWHPIARHASAVAIPWHPIARHASAVAIPWHPIARHASAVAIPWHPIARHASAVAIPWH